MARGTRVGLWHAEVGREQGGGRLLKFLGEADESTEITPLYPLESAGALRQLRTLNGFS